MAETKKGNILVKVHSYKRKERGKKEKVRSHDRSTPRTSKGKR